MEGPFEFRITAEPMKDGRRFLVACWDNMLVESRQVCTRVPYTLTLEPILNRYGDMITIQTLTLTHTSPARF